MQDRARDCQRALQEKRVSDVMTQLDKVYMLEASMRLTFARMLEIYRSGYTRVPIFEGHKQNIVGILYTKDLILVDPDDELEIQTVISFHGKAHVQYILDITPLDEVCTAVVISGGLQSDLLASYETSLLFTESLKARQLS